MTTEEIRDGKLILTSEVEDDYNEDGVDSRIAYLERELAIWNRRKALF